MKNLPIILLTSAVFAGSFAQAQTFPYSYDFENLTPGNVNTPSGNLNQPDANDNGWYGSNISSTNRVTVSDVFNSPWDVGGSQSAAIVRTDGAGAASLLNFFTDELNRYNFPSNVDMTGSLGSALTGSGYGFSFDAMTPNRSTQPRFRFFGGSELDVDTAFEIQMRFDGTLRINNVEVAAFTDSPNSFLNNIWYRFEITNLNVAAQSWDLEIFAWNGTSGDLIYSATDLGFMYDVSSIDRFQARSNSTNTNPIYFDNFVAIPEPATVACLFGAIALGCVLVRRQRS
jgi:hypothetical protein